MTPRFNPLKLLQFAAALMFLALSFSSLNARAAGSIRLTAKNGSSVVINSDSFEYDNDRQRIELTGNVKMVYEGQFVSCDHAVVDRANETLHAEGNLVISSLQAYVEGDSADLSYATNTGIIRNGFVKSGPVIFEGEIVKKTGPQSYDAEKASFTACTTCPTAWTFSGSRIQAEIGGYASIKNARLRIADVPVFWLPYLLVPLKSSRQTGFLTPTIDNNSDGGVALGWSFFWAISRSQDATITTKYYTKRSLKALFNYRYMLSENSEGEMNAGVINDEVFRKSSLLSTDPGSKVLRRFFRYSHNYELPNGFDQKLRINYVSDLLYPRDFPDEVLGSGDPALENRFTLTKNTERMHASLDTSYYINQLHQNPLSSNTDAVHRFPEIRWDVISRPIASSGLLSGLLFQFHSDYANFSRDDLAWDDVYLDGNGARAIDTKRSQPGGGVFDPKTDVIRTGQRLDLQPEIAAPFRIGSFIDVLPSVNLRHTQYSLNVAAPGVSDFDSSPYRQYVRGRLSMRTRLSRVYGDAQANLSPASPVTNWITTVPESVDGKPNEALKVPAVTPEVHPSLYRHEIEPEFVLTGIRDTHDANDSYFLGAVTQVPSFLDSQPISNADFLAGRGLQFDYEDRLTNRNTAGLFLSNRVVKKSWEGDTPLYRQIASFKVGQSFDFDEATVAGRQTFPYSDVSALLDLRLDYFETNTLVRYFPYHNKTNTSARARVRDTHNRFLEVNFAQNYLITQKTEEALPALKETFGFALGFAEKYIDFLGAIDMTPQDWLKGSFSVKSWSMRMNIKPPGDCWGIVLTLSQALGRPLDSKVTFDYSFGGAAPRIAAAN